MYKFREGFRAPAGLVAELAAKELERIREERGNLTAAVIVEESKSPDCVLHPAFVWDDSLAAQKYRERQANTLVRAIVVVEEKTGEREHPKYVFTMKEDKCQYMPTEIVVKDSAMYEYSLSRLSLLLAAAQRSVEDLMNAKGEIPAPRRRAVERASRHIEKAARAVSGV